MKRDIITEREITRGEIYWINPSPYRGNGRHVQRASRPGIIVSNEKINSTGQTFEIVFLTTQPKKDCDTHVTIRSSYETSTALCEQVQTVSIEQLGRYIGACSQQEMEAIDRSIMISLDLDISNAPSPKTRKESEDMDLREYSKRLRIEVIKAREEASLYHRMYEELMEKMIEIAKK